MTRLSAAALFAFGLPSVSSQPVYGPSTSFLSVPSLSTFSPVGGATFNPVASSFAPVGQTSYSFSSSFPLSAAAPASSPFLPVSSPTPASLYPSYPVYGPAPTPAYAALPVYGPPTPSVSYTSVTQPVYGPLAVSSNFATSSTFQPFTYASTPLFASAPLPVYGSTALPAASSALPAVTLPVYGATTLPVYGSAILPAPTPSPISCRAQNQLDVVKCYGITSGCFITQCALDGSYIPKQCAVYPCISNTGSCPQCWCVDAVSGVEVPFTRANTTAVTCAVAVAAPAEDLVPVRVRFRYPVGGGGGGGGGNGLLVCVLRPSACFGKGGGSGLPP